MSDYSIMRCSIRDRCAKQAQEIERLRMPDELVEKASAALNSTFAYDSKMVLRDILAWHESLKEGKE